MNEIFFDDDDVSPYYVLEIEALTTLEPQQVQASWLALPHPLGSIPLPLGLEGPSSRDEVELSFLGWTFSCRRWTICFCSAVMLAAALLTA